MRWPAAQNFRLIVRLINQHRILLAKGLATLLIVSTINLSIPAIIKNFIETLPEHNNTAYIVKFSALLIILFLFQGLFGYWRILYFNKLGIKIVAKIRTSLFDAILAKRIDFFATAKTGDLISRISTDCQLLQEILCSKLSVAIRYAVQVIGGVALMFWISFQLSILMLVALPILVLSSIFLAKKLKSYSLQIQKQTGHAASLAEESFTGIKILKIFPNTKLINNSFYKLIQNITELSLKRSKISAFFQSFISFLLYSLIVLFLLSGIYLANQQMLDYPSLTAFVLYSILVAVSFSFLTATADELTKGLAATRRIIEIIGDDLTPAFAEPKADLPRQSLSMIKHLALSNLSFHYPDREQKIINNLSLQLLPNRIYALTGPSGVGKSTLVNLILGFNKCSAGSISLLTKNNQLSHPDILDYISYVPQNPTIFDFSIKDNLLLANSEATEEDLWTVLEQVNLADFVRAQPAGLATLCGSHGLEISGGQQQKLAIARALLKNSPILILDESTSALDSDSESVVLNNLTKSQSERITLIITHRLSAIKACQEILLMNYDQRLIQGTHAELLQSSEYYQFIVNHQQG